LLSAHRQISYGILTNGTLINPDTARHLKELRPAFVQVSIEGTRETHDQIRGEGSYQKAIEGIANLTAAGVSAYISFTAYRRNYQDFPDVVRRGRKLGVSRIWADRLIPCGNGASLMDDLLDQEETLAFFKLMERSRKKKRPFLPDKKDVAMHRALQFLVGGGEPYHCCAGDTLITVLPNGDVLPCRRMPVVVGNIFEKPLKEIYLDDPFLQSLRDKNTICRGCEQCLFNKVCGGGLRCLSQAVNGSPFYADPGCWLSINRDKSRELNQ
jgi:radical SAM protein with 4Fe4S-binding SPASM domain